MANMLGKRAQQRQGYGGRHCPCCSIDKVVREQKHSTRQAEESAWREDVRDLPQGESWLDFMLDNVNSILGYLTGSHNYGT